ncbi:hypothetical protein D3C86_1272960 [compost metagenome]
MGETKTRASLVTLPLERVARPMPMALPWNWPGLAGSGASTASGVAAQVTRGAERAAPVLSLASAVKRNEPLSGRIKGPAGDGLRLPITLKSPGLTPEISPTLTTTRPLWAPVGTLVRMRWSFSTVTSLRRTPLR